MGQLFSVKATAPPAGVPAARRLRGGVEEAGQDNIVVSEAEHLTCLPV